MTEKITQLLMPRMGESITEGTIINWVVPEGAAFNEGDILVEVATDKVDNEVPAPYSGVLMEHLAQANEVVEVGKPIARYEITAGERTTTPSSEIKDTPKKAISQKPVPANKTNTTYAKQAVARTTVSDFFVSPLVDTIARKHHISYEELSRIPGSGKDGRLRKSDVMEYLDAGRPFQFAQAPSEAPGFQIPDLKFDKGTGKIVEMDRMRQMIADHMVFSKHTSPHVTAYVEADLTDLVHWRNEHKKSFADKHGEKLTFTPLFVRAVAKAIKEYPMINVSVDGNQIIVKEGIHIGMATALPSGNLIVPVVRNADQKDMVTLAKEVNRLASLARDNALKGDDIKGSTFTISNVGTFGSVMGTPIINQPEAAILATGIIKKRAEVMERPEGDQIEIRHMMYLSLSFDHRIIDGYLGGSFLKCIAEELETLHTNVSY